MSLGQIKVVMTLDDNGFASKITQNGKALKGLNNDLSTTATSVRSLDRHFSGLGHSFREFVVTTSLAKGAIQNIWAVTGGMAKSIADTNGEIERMTALMKGMSTATTEVGKSADAASSVNAIFDMARNAPIDVKALTDTYVKLKTTGVDPLKGSMQALVDANAHFGGNSDSLHRASIAIQQMSSKGVISMEELRQQLAEAIPNASALMARGVNMSVAEMVDKISKGQVRSKEALSLLFHEMDIEFAGSAKAMMNTWVGLTANLETEWTLFQKKIGDASYFDEAKSALKDLTSAFRTDEAAAAAAQFGHALGEITKSAVEMTKYMLANREEIGRWIKYSAEALVAVKSWGMISAAVAAVGTAVAAVGVEFAAATALIVETGEVMTVTGMLVGTLTGGLAALISPIGLITAALVGGAIAWANWGKSAEESVASANRSIIEGVRLSKDQLAELNKNIEEGAEASKRNEARKKGSISQGIDDFLGLGLPGYGAEADAEAARLAKSASDQKYLDEKLTKPKLDAEKIIAAQKQASDDIVVGIKDNIRAERVAAHDKIFGQDASKLSNAEYNKRAPEYAEFTKDQDARLLNQQIDALNKVTAEKIKEAGANKELAKTLSEVNEKRIAGMKDEFNTHAGARSSLLGEGKNKGDAAAKAAKKRSDELANHEISLEAQIAKKRAALSQPSQLGAGVLGVGPEEAKIRSLMESGKLYTEENAKQARIVDQLNKALVDKGKAEETLLSIEKQGSKVLEKLSVDNEHLQETLNNGGYETASRESMRYNEQLGFQRERLNEANEARLKYTELMRPEDVAAVTEEIRRSTAAFESNAQATMKAADAKSVLQYENAAIPEAKRIRASLVENTAERMDEEFALVRERFMKERQLTQEMVDNNVASRKEEIALLKAMEDEHARAIEHPLKTMARSWADTTQNMREASVGWMSDFTDNLVEMVSTGKASFSDFAASVLKDIAKIMMRAQLAKVIEAGFGQSETSGRSDSASSSSGWIGAILKAASSALFADGGIMSSKGKLPLNYYSNGGVASQPQVAIFGEGRQNEAFVPLPDGKSIPVTMSGAGGSGDVNNVNIEINVSKDGSEKDNSDNGRWGQMAGQVKNIVLKTIAEEKMPGGALNSGR